jgi:uncharacterized protein with LGFP repeats
MVTGASGTAATVSLSASSITGQASLSLSPNPLKFHSVDVGESVTEHFTVRNTGNIPLQFSKAAPPEGEFATSTPVSEGTTLQPGEAVKQQMTFTPTTKGSAAATYYFNFTDETNAVHAAQIEQLKGKGIDEIANYYESLGGPDSSLGKPQAPESAIGLGRVRVYHNGAIYWSAATGAHALHGAILTHYLAIGGPTSFAGFPISNVHKTSGAKGHDAHFAGAGTVIYTRHGVGTHEVNGAIRRRWDALGGISGRLGWPVSDEFSTSKGKRRSDFQHGHITWNPKTDQTKVRYTS